MTSEEVKALTSGLAQGQAIWYVLSAVLGGALAGLGGYLAEKGKGRATKEDIGAITRQMEKAKEDFNHRLEDLKAHHQLRLVAAERRLFVHQEAFERWVFLHAAVLDENATEAGKLAIELQHWFAKNCIFLSPKGRKGVHDTYKRAVDHFKIKNDPDATALLKSNKEQLAAIGNMFLAEVELPPMNKESVDALTKAVGAHAPQ